MKTETKFLWKLGAILFLMFLDSKLLEHRDNLLYQLLGTFGLIAIIVFGYIFLNKS